MTACSKINCTTPAAGALSVEIYPMPAFMRHYRTTKRLTRLIFDLPLCKAHADEVMPYEMFTPSQFDAFVRPVELSTGVTVDRAGCKVALVPFDDPEYLLLKKQQQRD